MIEQPNCTYSPLQIGLEKQISTFKNQVRKQIDALKVLKPDTQQITIKDAIPENQINKSQKWN